MSGRRPGRPIASARLSRAQTIDALRAGLDIQPARVAVYAGRAALHHLEAARAIGSALAELLAPEWDGEIL